MGRCFVCEVNGRAGTGTELVFGRFYCLRHVVKVKGSLRVAEGDVGDALIVRQRYGKGKKGIELSQPKGDREE